MERRPGRMNDRGAARKPLDRQAAIGQVGPGQPEQLAAAKPTRSGDRIQRAEVIIGRRVEQPAEVTGGQVGDGPMLDVRRGGVGRHVRPTSPALCAPESARRSVATGPASGL